MMHQSFKFRRRKKTFSTKQVLQATPLLMSVLFDFHVLLDLQLQKSYHDDVSGNLIEFLTESGGIHHLTEKRSTQFILFAIADSKLLYLCFNVNSSLDIHNITVIFYVANCISEFLEKCFKKIPPRYIMLK
mmetsp:Transcript_17498/g.25879  ORF Transcript_17498/g.25879 Transcript_17498/m.25879 type:complete len:131 (-) Transcript_17498:2831-3223(-)